MSNNPLGNKLVSVIIVLFFWAVCVFFLDIGGADYYEYSLLSYKAGVYIGYLAFAIGILLAIVNWRNNLFKLKK